MFTWSLAHLPQIDPKDERFRADFRPIKGGGGKMQSLRLSGMLRGRGMKSIQLQSTERLLAGLITSHRSDPRQPTHWAKGSERRGTRTPTGSGSPLWGGGRAKHSTNPNKCGLRTGGGHGGGVAGRACKQNEVKGRHPAVHQKNTVGNYTALG